MDRLLGWHTRAGELGLRLFRLHLLWLVWTLRGGVVLRVFPATAAVLAVVRRDEFTAGDDPDRGPLRREFGEAWRREFLPANALGAALAGIWALLLLDRHLLAVVDLGPAAPVVAGLLWVLSAAAFVGTACIGPLSAHYEGGAVVQLRRAAVLLLARPGWALLTAAVLGLVLCAYHELPGLVPVFGVVLPAYLCTSCLWAGGLLRPPAPPAAVPSRAAVPA